MKGSTDTVTSKNQVALPREVREDLHVVKGDRLIFLKDGDAWILRKAPARLVDALRETGKYLGGDVGAYHREFEEGWEER